MAAADQDAAGAGGITGAAKGQGAERYQPANIK